MKNMPLKVPEDLLKISPPANSNGTGPFRVFSPSGEEMVGVISVSIETHTEAWAKATIVVLVDVTNIKEK